MRERRLIVNAEDFGLAPGVNAGIVEAIEAGSVTSVSVLANAPGLEDALRRASSLTGRVGTGLHFNLTMGAPVSPPAEVRSLIDGFGRFLPLERLIRRGVAGGVSPAEVRLEADAQLMRLVSSGLRITHVDSHRHVHAYPWIRGALAAAAADRGVLLVRRPLEPLLARPRTRAAMLKRVALAAAWALPTGMRGEGVRPGVLARPGRPLVTVAFRGLALRGGPLYAHDLEAVLETLPDGTTELMVHPGRSDPPALDWAPHLPERETELEALLSERMRERFRSGVFDLTHFGALD
jgi:predicted glycoside hydrolase/deacetylase ChbG (UPF0249 family)